MDYGFDWDKINIREDEESEVIDFYIGDPDNYGGFGFLENDLDDLIEEAINESYEKLNLPDEFEKPREFRPEDLQAYHFAAVDNSTDLDEDIGLYVEELASSIRTKFNNEFEL